MPSSLLTNLLAWWKLDEAAGAPRLDSSGNGNTLAETGGTVASAAGLIGNAANFVATSYLLKSSAVFTGGDWTFACWINPTDLLGNPYDWVSNGGVSAAQRSIIRTTTTSLQWVNRNGGTASFTIGTGSWIHVVGVTELAVSCRLYVNGAMQATGTKPTSAVYGTAFVIGNNTGAGSGVNGLVDLAGVWNRALTAAEVTTLYNGGAGMNYPFGSFSDGKSF